jgi:hypothetical protein
MLANNTNIKLAEGSTRRYASKLHFHSPQKYRRKRKKPLTAYYVPTAPLQGSQCTRFSKQTEPGWFCVAPASGAASFLQALNTYSSGLPLKRTTSFGFDQVFLISSPLPHTLPSISTDIGRLISATNSSKCITYRLFLYMGHSAQGSPGKSYWDGFVVIPPPDLLHSCRHSIHTLQVFL